MRVAGGEQEGERGTCVSSCHHSSRASCRPTLIKWPRRATRETGNGRRTRETRRQQQQHYIIISLGVHLVGGLVGWPAGGRVGCIVSPSVPLYFVAQTMPSLVDCSTGGDVRATRRHCVHPPACLFVFLGQPARGQRELKQEHQQPRQHQHEQH